MKFEQVIDRIIAILERNSEAAILVKDIAEALEMSATQFSNAKARNRVPHEKIAVFCGRKRVSINWILFGQSVEMLNTDTENAYNLKLFDGVKASAGGGAFNEEDENYIDFILDPEYVKLLGISHKDNIDAIYAIGDSMEPTLNEGSIILIDRNKTEVTNSGMFVVNTSGSLYIKRLSLNPKGGLDLISDNTLYPIHTVPLDETFIVGKVIGALEKL